MKLVSLRMGMVSAVAAAGIVAGGFFVGGSLAGAQTPPSPTPSAPQQQTPQQTPAPRDHGTTPRTPGSKEDCPGGDGSGDSQSGTASGLRGAGRGGALARY